jgi:CRISPR-associated protein Cas2
MTLIVVQRVTPSLRGMLSRWMLELKPGVFVGSISARVRNELWKLVLGLKRLGACTMVYRAANEQGLTIAAHGDDTRAVVDYDGLSLLKRLSGSKGSVPPAKHAGEACGGDPSTRGPVEAGTLGRTVDPDGGASLDT